MHIYDTKLFIERAKAIYGNKYEYAESNYITAHIKVKVRCSIHGVFNVSPSNHINGRGCRTCGINQRTTSITKDKTSFINQAKEKYGKQFSYEKMIYVRSKSKIIITCSLHGDFEQSPQNHLRFIGCIKCQAEHKRKLYSDDTKKFVRKAIEKYGDRYGYDRVDYKNSRSKIIIGCKIHGGFLQSPNVHLSGSGCPRCNNSKGEVEISNWLTKQCIIFEQEVKMPNCKHKRALPFDFGVFKENKLVGLIEYQGEQHYIPIKRSNWSVDKVQEKFSLLQQRDQLKRDYCKQNSVPLLEIPYWEFIQIPEILAQFTLAP